MGAIFNGGRNFYGLLLHSDDPGVYPMPPSKEF